ncbi:50S ribosomal protein L27, chloroplastic [Tanacetum coccineum]|uniref:50S ribosomal protein L27, chloroplastic n=1 Tax=Tanacetum coccineum TaxID=301880 RepID=A0ABQ4ZYN1_9ASTR
MKRPVHPGKNVGIGEDHAIFTLIDGLLKYEKFGPNRKKKTLPFFLGNDKKRKSGLWASSAYKLLGTSLTVKGNGEIGIGIEKGIAVGKRLIFRDILVNSLDDNAHDIRNIFLLSIRISVPILDTIEVEVEHGWDELGSKCKIMACSSLQLADCIPLFAACPAATDCTWPLMLLILAAARGMQTTVDKLPNAVGLILSQQRLPTFMRRYALHYSTVASFQILQKKVPNKAVRIAVMVSSIDEKKAVICMGKIIKFLNFDAEKQNWEKHN